MTYGIHREREYVAFTMRTSLTIAESPRTPPPLSVQPNVPRKSAFGLKQIVNSARYSR
jgi:hypothetical protein